MRKSIYLFLSFFVILIIACTGNKKQDVIKNPYEGAWEIIYHKVIYPDTTITTTRFENPVLKILSKKFYSFGNQLDQNRVWGGGGEYKVTGDTFISYPKYHSNARMVGDSIVFKSEIEGDRWTIYTVYKMDTLSLESTETWRRLIE
jgi:hypothetical protein